MTEVVIIEANIDDMNPEWVEPLLEALFAAGALDAWLTPIVMKKGRPAVTISVLVSPARRNAVSQVLLCKLGTVLFGTVVLPSPVLASAPQTVFPSALV